MENPADTSNNARAAKLSTGSPRGAAQTPADLLDDLSRAMIDSLEKEAVTATSAVAAPKAVPTLDGNSEPKQSGEKLLEKQEPLGGIEILVKLAENGDIDPKNVDIIDVTDKFLRAIAAAPKENLRQSGKILFHASVLLRMKAEALLAFANLDADGGDDFMDFDEEGGIIFDSKNQAVGRQITLRDLERALVRKANNRQNRARKVTLEQLIDALREAEKIEKKRVKKEPRAVIDLAGQHEVNDVSDILDLAHDEDIDSTIDQVEQILANQVETGEAMALLQLIILLGRRGDWVDAFLAILFLSNAGKITLEQQEFYGPLYVVRSDSPPASPTLASEKA